MIITGPPLVDAESTRAWGTRLGRTLRAGDLVILTGGLGAGKTTLTQGIAQGLDVRGPITSPTFVIARVHPSLVGGPALVHVDAYRLGGALGGSEELDGLDLDADLDLSVTIVEWGAGLVEGLAADALEVTITGESTRIASVSARGPRWDTDQARAELASLADEVDAQAAGEASR